MLRVQNRTKISDDRRCLPIKSGHCFPTFLFSCGLRLFRSAFYLQVIETCPRVSFGPETDPSGFLESPSLTSRYFLSSNCRGLSSALWTAATLMTRKTIAT
jgi:hypothetical protein